MPNDIVFPGDVLATAEEYMAGDGVYLDDGNVCSSIAGQVYFDRDEMIVSVRAMYRPALPAVNDIIHGRVASVDKKMVKVDLLRIEGNN